MGSLTLLNQIASEAAQVLGYKQTRLDVLVRMALSNTIVLYYLLASQGVNYTLAKLLCLY